MIRRSPCELYIKFLLVHPRGFSVEEIKNKLHEMGLDFPSEAYVGSLQARLSPPSLFHPTDKTHKASQRFIMKHRLRGFFDPDEASAIAHDLVKNPRAKELIETLTLTEEPLALISSMVRQQGSRCTVAALQRYTTYYWDLSLVDSVETRALLQMRVDHIVNRDDGEEVKPYERMQHAALKRATYKDPRFLVTEMPITPMAGLLNRMRMGYLPTQVDLTRLAHATRVVCTVRAYGEAMSGAPHSAASARDFAVVSRVMTDLINEMGSPDVELHKELQSLALQTEDARPPNIHQLSGGHHTMDLQPMTIEAETDGD